VHIFTNKSDNDFADMILRIQRNIELVPQEKLVDFMELIELWWNDRGAEAYVWLADLYQDTLMEKVSREYKHEAVSEVED
jgi:hypothetical protein